MGLDKERSKNGNYVSSLLQLFDWSAKSRKKLFSCRSDSPEHSKQGKRSDGNITASCLNLMDEDDTKPKFCSKEIDDHSSGSLMADDAHESRAPGVVARLMGLDSLPALSYAHPKNTSVFDASSFRDHSCCTKSDGLDEPTIVSPYRCYDYDMPRRISSKPIDRFQSEILPPKSARPVRLSQQRLLSPIKGPGFIPRRTTECIVEAAAKIIDSQASRGVKPRVFVSSSVPLNVGGFEPAIEEARKKPIQEVGNQDKPLTRHSNHCTNFSSRVSGGSKGSMNRKLNDYTVTHHEPDPGKSVSLAIQAKTNIQRRGGLSSNGSPCVCSSQRGQNASDPSSIVGNRHNATRGTKKKPNTRNGYPVLKQNNQKQNGVADKSKSSRKPSKNSSAVGRRATSTTPRQRKAARTPPGPTARTGNLTCLEVPDGSKIGPHNLKKDGASMKKRPSGGGVSSQKVRPVGAKFVEDKDRGYDCRKDFIGPAGKRKGTDVVSFTFTAPMSGGDANSDPSQEDASSGGTQVQSLSCKRDNVTNGGSADALSDLLERKLMELASQMGPTPTCPFQQGAECGTNIVSQEMSSPHRSEIDEGIQNMPFVCGSHKNGDLDDFLENSCEPRKSGVCQSVYGGSEECDGRHVSDTKILVDCRRPSPVSVLDSSLSSESSSLDSPDSSGTCESTQCSYAQGVEILGICSSKIFPYLDTELDLSDSVSSSSSSSSPSVVLEKEPIKNPITFHTSDGWEEECTKKVLDYIGSNLEAFQIGMLKLDPSTTGYTENGSDLVDPQEYNVTLDCVRESLELRGKRCFGGGFVNWVQGVVVMSSRDWLARETLREVTVWKSMREHGIDDVIETDMSNHHGNWLNFDTATFELGVDIESQIFASLLNELVDDVSLSCC